MALQTTCRIDDRAQSQRREGRTIGCNGAAVVAVLGWQSRSQPPAEPYRYPTGASSPIMDASPYVPPPITTDRSMSFATPPLDTLCFVINFTFSTLFFIACVSSIGTADNPFAFVGGLLFVLPVACYAVAEWVCWYRERNWLFRPLGILNLVLAAFVAFALVTNVGEALMADEPIDPWFIMVLSLGFVFVAGYLAWCGWRRIHAMRGVPSAIQNDG